MATYTKKDGFLNLRTTKQILANSRGSDLPYFLKRKFRSLNFKGCKLNDTVIMCLEYDDAGNIHGLSGIIIDIYVTAYRGIELTIKSECGKLTACNERDHHPLYDFFPVFHIPQPVDV